MKLLKRYNSDNGGNVAMMFAGLSTMLLFATGFVIDYTSANKLKVSLQSQADIAVLSAARALKDHAEANKDSDDDDDDNDFDYKKHVHEVMLANGYDANAPAPYVEFDDGLITVKAVVPHKTMFAGAIGRDKMDVGIMSQADLFSASLAEIVLVLDNTASMTVDGKMTALKDGAKDLVKAVKDSKSGAKIGLVPFSKYVRLDTSYRGSGWLRIPNEYDTTRNYKQSHRTGGTCHKEERTIDRDGVPYTYDADICSGQTTTYTDETKTIKSRWDGCVGTREAPYNTMDENNYSIRIPGLLNNQPHEATGLSADVKAYCPDTIVELTNDYDDLKNSINNLFGTDNTYIPSGLIWGKRVLSANAPFDEGNASPTVSKIMILMSDGMNTAQIDDSADAQAEMKAPPYLSNTDTDDTATDANILTANLCSQFKSEGIKMYVIAFKVDDAATSKMLADCASSPANSFVAGDNDALIKSFENIAKSLENEVRLTK